MPISLDHTIVWVHDHAESAAFLAGTLGLPEPERFGPFLVFRMDNGVSLDLYEQGADAKIERQHYAFRVDPKKFGEILAGVQARGLEYWGDPGRTRAGEVYEFREDRGFYFLDPNGHLLEVITERSTGL
jgi:catechol 2,3-dioxygenase-like lactoylglutathione lyase family enzyme